MEITSVGKNRTQVYDVLRTHRKTLGLRVDRILDTMNSAPVIIAKLTNKEDCYRLKAALEKAGATVKVNVL